jgi:predicted transcriptional regulator
LTQVEAAQRLGTTQAAISQYINSKRAFKGAEQFGEVLPMLKAMAQDTAKRLAANEITHEEISLDFCKLCLAFCGAKAASQVVEDYVI